MNNDINKAISVNPIKNGTVVVSTKVTGLSSKDIYNQYVKNYPTINDIQSKYNERFDDPSYYFGGGADGGDVA